VQAISTSTYIGANEVQTISTWATRVDAVQYVTSSATSVYEVQVSQRRCTVTRPQSQRVV
jgi:hypothetical protein